MFFPPPLLYESSIPLYCELQRMKKKRGRFIRRDNHDKLCLYWNLFQRQPALLKKNTTYYCQEHFSTKLKSFVLTKVNCFLSQMGFVRFNKGTRTQRDCPTLAKKNWNFVPPCQSSVSEKFLNNFIKKEMEQKVELNDIILQHGQFSWWPLPIMLLFCDK